MISRSYSSSSSKRPDQVVINVEGDEDIKDQAVSEVSEDDQNNNNKNRRTIRTTIRRNNDEEKEIEEKFNVKNKKYRGYESIRKAVRREWDKKEKEMKEGRGGTKIKEKAREEADSDEEDPTFDESEEED